MRYLVTGCAGFIGSHLTEALLSEGHHVIGVDCFNANYARGGKLRNLELARQWDEFDFVPIDLSRGDLGEFVADCDAVFHLAAEPGVRSSWGDRFEYYLRNNILATQLLLDAMHRWPDKRVVYASSSSVYGQAEQFPTPESVVPSPMSPYGATKLTAEHLCQLYHANYGLDVVMLRYFSVYGPRQRPDMAFDAFCRAALRGEEIVVFGDGLQTRDFTYVADIVDATMAAVAVPDAVGKVMNVGGGSQTSVRDALALIEGFAGRGLNVRHDRRREGDVNNTSADTSQAEATLGYRPKFSFLEGLQQQFDWVAGRAGVTEA
jgi:nucleoside-diphosphate-sugar epimerase